MSKDTSTPASNVEAFPIQISLADLSLAVEIIDIVSKRGAVNGNEMQLVGSLRNKFENFVQANTPKADKQQKSTETDVPPAI